MDVEKFLNSLDNLFEKKKINEVPAFLEENYKEAVRENDLSAQFTILNEMMGFFRDISEYEKSIKACHQCIDVMQKMGIQGSVHYATSLQNIANAHRAAGLLKEALQYYMEAFRIYERNIDSNDYRFASLHNNIALLYQEIGDYETAVAHLKKALSIIKECYSDGINLEETARRLHVTEQYLGTQLKKETGSSFTEIIRRYKIAHVKQLLLDTELKLNQIASMAGFSDPKYMSKVFKQEVGMLPNEYRRMNT